MIEKRKRNEKKEKAITIKSLGKVETNKKHNQREKVEEYTRVHN